MRVARYLFIFLDKDKGMKVLQTSNFSVQMRLKVKFVKQVKVEEYCAPSRVDHTPKFHTNTKLYSVGLKTLLGSTLKINSVEYQT